MLNERARRKRGARAVAAALRVLGAPRASQRAVCCSEALERHASMIRRIRQKKDLHHKYEKRAPLKKKIAMIWPYWLLALSVQ
jgi:hypothetical protein